MRPPLGYIPRLYAPLRLSTRQSFGPSPALTAAATATRSTRRLTFKSRMSTSSGPQSTTMWPAAGQGEGEEERSLNGSGTGSHREHHPTESTSPAPKKTTSNAPAEASPNTSGADSSQCQPHSQGDDQGLAGAQRRDGPLALPPLPEGHETSSAAGGTSAGGRGGGDNNNNNNNNNNGVSSRSSSSSSSSSSGSNTITLDMSRGDASTKLDHLGPLVVNQDGTMSRISNWGEMTEIERRNTVRILSKRNQLRLAGLRGEKEKNGAEAGK
ncbi:uncharacterized protein BDZ83DRAFT_753177 [Colletotrichum acutatum]|uniref:Uncharacterized protein n=1 Tax=Glomerella acutata TaxID=27357 RepID=A0AAD8UH42_GLOAC|nr:uncharacterized protein BDZ83DRAFT_753177 [Colletotrichum acutatum]KAK1723801.1 hypothetical protein BDZ83DRAFT_753177 [Colletotrichum acutatum]